jgi:hypothetical protein
MKGRMLVAERKVKRGEVVFIEPPAAWVTFDDSHDHFSNLERSMLDAAATRSNFNGRSSILAGTFSS